jgi:hypothetical protein
VSDIRGEELRHQDGVLEADFGRSRKNTGLGSEAGMPSWLRAREMRGCPSMGSETVKVTS